MVADSCSIFAGLRCKRRPKIGAGGPEKGGIECLNVAHKAPFHLRRLSIFANPSESAPWFLSPAELRLHVCTKPQTDAQKSCAYGLVDWDGHEWMRDWPKGNVQYQFTTYQLPFLRRPVCRTSIILDTHVGGCPLLSIVYRLSSIIYHDFVHLTATSTNHFCATELPLVRHPTNDPFFCTRSRFTVACTCCLHL